MQIICFNNHKFPGIGLVLLMSSVRDGTFWNSNKAFYGTWLLCEHRCSLKHPELWSWDDWQPEKVFKVGTGTTLTAWVKKQSHVSVWKDFTCDHRQTEALSPAGVRSHVMDTNDVRCLSSSVTDKSQSFPHQQLRAFNETKQRYRASGSLSSLVLETRLQFIKLWLVEVHHN